MSKPIRIGCISALTEAPEVCGRPIGIISTTVRAVLIRWNKKPESYLALLHFASGIIAWQHAPPGQAVSLTLAFSGWMARGFHEAVEERARD